jgi:uracil-DNA glycosylase
MSNMCNLFNEIENCGGKENCFGKVKGEVCPIVFALRLDTMKIMVITEQPRLDRVNKEMLKTALQKGPKNSIPWRLKELLGNEFCKSIVDENGIFYWTHYIKCRGEFRKFEEKMDIDKCADMYLEREIKYIKPSLIISIGGRCSSWILKRFKGSAL